MLDQNGDDYVDVLLALGRSAEDDLRISIHESGHAVAARLLGNSIGGATVDPGPGYEGRVWGPHHVEAFGAGRGDAKHVKEALAPFMPKPGDDIKSVPDVFANIFSSCIELMAGRGAEAMLLEDREPSPPIDDLRQARELALLICTSEEAVQAFLQYCSVAARDLLLPHGDVVVALSVVLRIKRTLDGAQIDEVIANVVTAKRSADEHARRAAWKRAVESAAHFTESLKGTRAPDMSGIGGKADPQAHWRHFRN